MQAPVIRARQTTFRGLVLPMYAESPTAARRACRPCLAAQFDSTIERGCEPAHHLPFTSAGWLQGVVGAPNGPIPTSPLGTLKADMVSSPFVARLPAKLLCLAVRRGWHDPPGKSAHELKPGAYPAPGRRPAGGRGLPRVSRLIQGSSSAVQRCDTMDSAYEISTSGRGGRTTKIRNMTTTLTRFFGSTHPSGRRPFGAATGFPVLRGNCVPEFEADDLIEGISAAALQRILDRTPPSRRMQRARYLRCAHMWCSLGQGCGRDRQARTCVDGPGRWSVCSPTRAGLGRCQSAQRQSMVRRARLPIPTVLQRSKEPSPE